MGNIKLKCDLDWTVDHLVSHQDTCTSNSNKKQEPNSQTVNNGIRSAVIVQHPRMKKVMTFSEIQPMGCLKQTQPKHSQYSSLLFQFFFLGGESLFHKDNLNELNISFPFQLSGFFHFLNCTYQVSVLFLNNDLASVEYMNVIIVLNFSS